MWNRLAKYQFLSYDDGTMPLYLVGNGKGYRKNLGRFQGSLMLIILFSLLGIIVLAIVGAGKYSAPRGSNAFDLVPTCKRSHRRVLSINRPDGNGSWYEAVSL